MDQTIIIAVLVAAVLILGGMLLFQQRRSKQLRSRFGPEYEREVRMSGNRRKAEAELLDREKRVQSLSIRPLSDPDRDRFIDDWRRVQAEFVDDPQESIARADALIGEVMSTRGYPVSNFDQIAADVSVDHPAVVQHYRAGHSIAVRHERGEASTEDLRQAMIHYRELFAELVTDEDASRRKSGDREKANDPARPTR
jgi:hypothetical protein